MTNYEMEGEFQRRVAELKSYKNPFIEAKLNEMGILLCPLCGSEYLHQQNVEAYTDHCRAVVYKNGVLVDHRQDNYKMHDSFQSNSIFECEHCLELKKTHVFHIKQCHGNTKLVWENLETSKINEEMNKLEELK